MQQLILAAFKLPTLEVLTTTIAASVAVMSAVMSIYGQNADNSAL